MGSLKGIVTGCVCSMVVFVAANALAGTGVGGVFNLGEGNSVDKTTELSGKTSGSQLLVSNGFTGATAVKADAPAGVAVSGRSTSSKGVLGSSASNIGGYFTSGNLAVKAAGTNGGVDASATASGRAGVFAHHDGSSSGYGLWAQSGNGPALRLTTSGANAPMSVNSTTRIPNLNADMVDGFHAGIQTGPHMLVATGLDGKLPLGALPDTAIGTEKYVDGCDLALTNCSVFLPENGGYMTIPFLLAPGSYLLTAKTVLFANTITPHRAECRLLAGTDVDQSLANLGFGKGAEYFETIGNVLMHTFPTAGNAYLRCRASGGADVVNMKFAAVRLDSETHTAVTAVMP